MRILGQYNHWAILSPSQWGESMELKFQNYIVETQEGTTNFYGERLARMWAGWNNGKVRVEEVCVDANKVSTHRLVWLAEQGNKVAEMQLNVRLNALPHKVSVLREPDWNGGHRPSLSSYVEDAHGLPDFTYIEAEGSPRSLMEMTFSGHAEPLHEEARDWEVSFADLVDEYLFGWEARWLC